jgi:hypothetical protein
MDFSFGKLRHRAISPLMGEKPSSAPKALKTTRYREDDQLSSRTYPNPLSVISPYLEF